MNYQQAYSKIIDAYFKDEIMPLKANFCFCGTLCDGNMDWRFSDYNGHYKYKEYGMMEKALFSAFPQVEWIKNGDVDNQYDNLYKLPDYEERLFAGMSAALEVLKEIHRSRGEDVDAITVPFTKRQLA